jgi:hypothetical protein
MNMRTTTATVVAAATNIQFRSFIYFFSCLFYSPKANYKVSTNKEINNMNTSTVYIYIY